MLDVAIIGAGATGTELSAELHGTARGVVEFGLDKIDPDKDIKISLIEAADGTRVGEIQIWDGPVGQAGGPQAHGERLDISMINHALLEVSCASDDGTQLIPPMGAQIRGCPDPDGSAMGAMLVLHKEGEGVYRGGCEWEDGPTITWSAEFHVVSP